MGHGDSSSRAGGCGDDVAAYALGALDDDERQRFERHLESCVICPDELAAFQQVVDWLLVGVPERPVSKGLRRRLMAEVSRDARRRRAAGQTGDAERQRRARRVRSWRLPPLGIPSPAAALGAVFAVVLIAVGGLELRAWVRGDSRVFHAHAAGASAEVRLYGGRAALVVHHLASPPSGQIYEVWLNRPGRHPQPTSALFSVTARGDGTVGVPGNLDGVQQVMVTREPAGGSRSPTRPATITVNLT